METGIKNLCLAGGVALNCVANGKLVKEQIFDDIWIQPASGDAGSALGAALLAYYQYFKKNRIINPDDSMKGTYLGCEFSNSQITNYLKRVKAPYEQFKDEILFMINFLLIFFGTSFNLICVVIGATEKFLL